jgi:LPPG:FO 2-phospho-L-lactate transferase
MRVVALAGGTGSAKLLRGLAALRVDLTVVCNVGDNFVWRGLLICPDIDIAMYSLAGIADERQGWGVAGDTFNALAELGRLGGDTWFRMGDRDLATSILRTEMLGRGVSLTRATEELRKKHMVAQRVLPVTDDFLETHITTAAGEIHLQEFWVKGKGKARVKGVVYQGATNASVSNQVREAILGAERIVVCPANPVTSIGPMLAVGGMEDLLVRAPGRVVGLSPMRGGGPFSGPAGKLMRATHHRPDSVGVAQLYSKFLDVLVIDRADAGLREEVVETGPGCRLSRTRIRSRRDAVRLARELIVA